jgi:hypothetical protein
MKKHTTVFARLGVLAALLLGGCWGDVDIVDEPDVTSVGGSAGAPVVGVDPLTPVRTCEVDDVRCGEGHDVERCVSFGTGQGWLKLQHCASAALCNADSATCTEPKCAFGEVRCNGAVPERCNEDQTAREQLSVAARVASRTVPRTPPGARARTSRHPAVSKRRARRGSCAATAGSWSAVATIRRTSIRS